MVFRKRSNFLLYLFLLSVFFVSGVFGGEKSVSRVVISGNRRIQTDAIQARIETRAGEFFSPQSINADLKRLYDWGPFTLVEIETEADGPDRIRVLVRVQEKPIIKKIIFEGNRKFKDKKLRKEILSRDGDVVSELRLDEDLTVISDLYRDKGYFQVRVEVQVKTDQKTGEAVVIFDVREGRSVRIKKITIDGARKVKAGKLLGLMKTKRKSLLMFRRGIFKKMQFEEDLEKIVFYYRFLGYLDMKILEVEKSYSDDKRRMFIRIEIEEGEQYKMGEILIAGNEEFTTAELAKQMKLEPGEVYTPEALRSGGRALQDFYLSHGYIDAVILPSNAYNQETSRMDIEYLIRENQISHIHRIDIRGNTITKDVVIRRELSVKPGQVYNGLKVRRSRQKLYGTGFFDQVNIKPVATDFPGEKDVLIQVHEKKTGELLFGVGYSSMDDFMGFAEVGLGNFDLFNFSTFQGAGQKIRLRGEFGNKRSNYELSFTEPWLFGIPLSFGVDLYARRRYWSDYAERRKGGDLRLRKRLTGFAQVGLIYRLEQVEISDIDSGAYWAVQSEAGKNWISSITPSLTRDTRDNNYIPTRGLRNILACKIAGVGGDKEFIKTTFRNSFYFSISNLFRHGAPPIIGRDPRGAGHVLGFRFDMGTAQPYGDTDIVPVYERFYLGGANTVRGFRYREVGPHDGHNEPIGGDSMVMGSAEYTFPIISVIRGALFCDIGNVWMDKDWEGDNSMLDSTWFENLNSGAGFGLRLYLPIGPIKLDYGWPLRTGPDGWNDTGGRFHFNIGYAF